MDTIPIVMTIAGSDSGGGAGIEADIKAFAALGVHGTCAITSITSQNTTGVLSAFDIPTSGVASQIEAVCTDMNISWAKTGMLSSPDIVRSVVGSIKKYDLNVVVDPVMTAEAGGDLLSSEALAVVRDELMPVSKLVTPNISEAEALSGMHVQTRQDCEIAARAIAELGVDNVVITGGHFDASDLIYVAATDTFSLIEGDFVNGGTHGSGCTYSAALTAYLARGLSVVEAARRAKRFVERAIGASVPIGRGAAPVNQFLPLLQDASRAEVMENTTRAVDVLAGSAPFAGLVPEVGCNIAMALPDARGVTDVAAVNGRIVRLRDRSSVVGCVGFGASSHVARIILAAMQFDEQVRACVNIRYSSQVLKACADLGLTISSFDRMDEPADTSTMDWGVTYAIKEYGSVPDIIYDEGGVGKEPMVRVLGRSALDVAELAAKIAGSLDR
ncbi:MAG: bifunctional hydroxymethylpyrimidine kinase/phosphomethylpyrimidine kinase [Euryarchaeota archaeon]|nr:bifunctional hydroxymethylpyrimidine kinase/phosphomethylpyrimidine kinase [Euryarchaeota archaeon]